MGKMVYDGIEITTIADFANESKVTVGSVTTWLKKHIEETGAKAVLQVGSTQMWSVADLMAARNKYKWQAKPKPVEFDDHKRIVKELEERLSQWQQWYGELFHENTTQAEAIKVLIENNNQLQAALAAEELASDSIIEG